MFRGLILILKPTVVAISFLLQEVCLLVWLLLPRLHEIKINTAADIIIMKKRFWGLNRSIAGCYLASKLCPLLLMKILLKVNKVGNLRLITLMKLCNRDIIA